MATDNLDTTQTDIIDPIVNPALNGAGHNASDDSNTFDDLLANSKNSTAYKTIEENMFFWMNEAKEITEDIRKLIRQTPTPGVAALLGKCVKDMGDLRAKAVDAAKHLIQHQAPKLTAVDKRTSKTHRYVIRAPMMAPTAEEWFRQAAAQAGAVDNTNNARALHGPKLIAKGKEIMRKMGGQLR